MNLIGYHARPDQHSINATTSSSANNPRRWNMYCTIQGPKFLVQQKQETRYCKICFSATNLTGHSSSVGLKAHVGIAT